MGFGTKLRRFLSDEPIFKPEDVSTEEKQLTAATTPDVEVGDVVPIMRIDHAESATEDGYSNVYAHIHNESSETVTLQSIGILGVTRELGMRLPGKESQRVLLFVGVQPPETATMEAELRYKTGDNTVLAAHYRVHGESKGGEVLISEFELQIPIREEAEA
ncbi:MAG TPA: hypothetical protein VF261_01540 [Candidatus Saccharimonadales bacterium]